MKGIPAFPIPLTDNQTYSNYDVADGMTLRDYFAAKAMQAHCEHLMKNPIQEERYEDSINDLSAYSYQIADAMLKQREK